MEWMIEPRDQQNEGGGCSTYTCYSKNTCNSQCGVYWCPFINMK